jgi:diaminopimelate decarboxylase
MLKQSFGPTVSHRLAIKSNPCTELLKYAYEKHDMGGECASVGEALLALNAAKMPPSHVVFDSPCKTVMELQWALKQKIFTNFDNFVEMERAKALVEQDDSELKKMVEDKQLGVCGLRINPLVGTGGGTAALCVSTEDSKFGIPITQRAQLIKAYADNPWMSSVHVHVGSGGMGSKILMEGIKTTVEFAKEVNKNSGFQQITDIDIGGGAPANYFTDTWGHDSNPNVPTFGEYAAVLKSEVLSR